MYASLIIYEHARLMGTQFLQQKVSDSIFPFMFY